jgi:cytochrome c oxidase subunit 1
MVLGTPVLAITLVLVVLERTVGIGVFDPTKGGDPLLFQHLFWFYSHPAVYIMILPGMGVISEVISTFSPQAGLRLYRGGLLLGRHCGLRVLRLGPSHVHHGRVELFGAGLFAADHAGRGAFRHQDLQLGGSLSTRVPSPLRRRCCMPSALWACSPSAASPASFWASLGMDIHLTETYFIVAHFHFVMVGGMLMAYLSGIHFWWPKMTGQNVSRNPCPSWQR